MACVSHIKLGGCRFCEMRQKYVCTAKLDGFPFTVNVTAHFRFPLLPVWFHFDTHNIFRYKAASFISRKLMSSIHISTYLSLRSSKNSRLLCGQASGRCLYTPRTVQVLWHLFIWAKIRLITLGGNKNTLSTKAKITTVIPSPDLETKTISSF
jgi:hypothetical protein